MHGKGHNVTLISFANNVNRVYTTTYQVRSIFEHSFFTMLESHYYIRSNAN